MPGLGDGVFEMITAAMWLQIFDGCRSAHKEDTASALHFKFLFQYAQKVAQQTEVRTNMPHFGSSLGSAPVDEV
jgi:hypothetical protein